MTFRASSSPAAFTFSRRFRTLLLGGAFAFALSACGGSVSANAEAKAGTDGQANGEANFDVEGEHAWDQVDESQSEAQTSETGHASRPETASGKNFALLGARHDLLLSSTASTQCKCLAVVLGGVDAAGLTWTGRRPLINSNSQLVVALGSNGVSCSESSTGASYMGYVKKSGNVIVSVESAVEGRPITHGAIIPRPDAGGKVYIKPEGKIPYGQGLKGEARCTLELK